MKSSACLALHLKNRLPTATHLALGILLVGGAISRGAALTGLERLDGWGAVRHQGKITPVPLGHKIRTFNFRRGASGNDNSLGGCVYRMVQYRDSEYRRLQRKSGPVGIPASTGMDSWAYPAQRTVDFLISFEEGKVSGRIRRRGRCL